MADLSDQQLAGLLMIAACPLSYLTAGVVLAAQMLADLGSTSGSPDGRKLSLVR
jgi:putative membrane protein